MDSTPPRAGLVQKIMFGQLALLFTAHLAGDFFAGVPAPLQPYLKETLRLSLVQMAVITACLALTSNLLQPAYGILGERWGYKRFIVVGVALSSVGMSALGAASSFAAACAIVLLGGIGVGMLHPAGAALAGKVTSSWRSTAISIYMSGGNVGLLMVPLIVPLLAEKGPKNVFLLAIPGILIALALAALLPRLPKAEPHAVPRLGDLVKMYPKLADLHLHVVLRFVPLNAFFGFLAVHSVLRGLDKVQAGQLLAVYVLVAATGQFLGGCVADRFPRKPFVVISELGGAGLLFIAPMAHGTLFYVALFGGALMAHAATSLQVVVAQERIPKGAAAASAIVMGFAYGMASLILIPIGRFGDYWSRVSGSELTGVTRMLQVSTAFMFVAALLALFSNMYRRDETREAV